MAPLNVPGKHCANSRCDEAFQWADFMNPGDTRCILACAGRCLSSGFGALECPPPPQLSFSVLSLQTDTVIQPHSSRSRHTNWNQISRSMPRLSTNLVSHSRQLIGLRHSYKPTLRIILPIQQDLSYRVFDSLKRQSTKLSIALSLAVSKFR